MEHKMEMAPPPPIPKRESSLAKTKSKVGHLKIIMTMMFGGKTSYQLHIADTLGYACKVLYINHQFDTRAAGDLYSTHNVKLRENLAAKLPNTTMIQVGNLSDVPLSLLETHPVVCIDEAQFFPDLCEKVNYMVDELCLDVFVAGLNGDYKRKKFGHILDLIPNADDVIILRETLCSRCASKGDRVVALFTWKINDESKAQIEIGANNYMPVCRSCHNALEKGREEADAKLKSGSLEKNMSNVPVNVIRKETDVEREENRSAVLMDLHKRRSKEKVTAKTNPKQGCARESETNVKKGAQSVDPVVPLDFVHDLDDLNEITQSSPERLRDAVFSVARQLGVSERHGVSVFSDSTVLFALVADSVLFQWPEYGIHFRVILLEDVISYQIIVFDRSLPAKAFFPPAEKTYKNQTEAIGDLFSFLWRRNEET